MSLARRQALISGVVWLIISLVFTAALTRVGMDDFAGAGGKATRALMASVILPGYLVNLAIIWRSRRAKRAGDLDERDEAVERKATEFTAIVLILTVYLFGIWLYETHDESGSVPAGWLYVLAYGTVTLVSLVHPIATLIIDRSGRVDA